MIAPGELPLTTSIDHLKHCIMVKLTDTSYKILQEHLKNVMASLILPILNVFLFGLNFC